LIVKLTDANHDGVADSVVTIASGLKGPFGIAFRGDTMYVAEESELIRFDPGAREPVTIMRLPGGGHSTRTIVFGPDGKMYVAVGSSCNLCAERDSMRAAVTQFNPDGSGGHIFAKGLRNTVGLAFNPKTGELWGGNNDRDNLGDDVPPEHINIIKDGRNYGWPECYLPGKPNPEYGSANCANVEPPAITVQAHSAPLGLAFYTGTQFPASIAVTHSSPYTAPGTAPCRREPRSCAWRWTAAGAVPWAWMISSSAGSVSMARAGDGRSEFSSRRMARSWSVTTTAARSGG